MYSKVKKNIHTDQTTISNTGHTINQDEIDVVKGMMGALLNLG